MIINVLPPFFRFTVYIYQKHKRQTEKNPPQLTKQTKPSFGMPYTILGQQTERALFLQPHSMHRASKSSQTNYRNNWKAQTNFLRQMAVSYWDIVKKAEKLTWFSQHPCQVSGC